MQRSFESPKTEDRIQSLQLTVHLHGYINNSIIGLNGGLPSNIQLGLLVNSVSGLHLAFYICKQDFLYDICPFLYFLITLVAF